jgi:predicted acyltransferase
MSATLTAAATVEQTTLVAPQRVQSVDVLRGITVAFMILVNDPGDWSHLFSQLDHAEWNGWTLTDLVFPTFLFLVGASIVFSLSSRVAKGNCWKTMTGQVVWRTVKILLLQFVLVFFPRMHWHRMRLYGVLPRIALCYLLAGLVMIAVIRRRDRVKIIVCVVVALLVGYWVLLRWVQVPGAGLPARDVPFLDETQNLTAWIDRAAMHWTQHWLHTGSLFNRTRDPEGLLSTLPATATTLLGSLAAFWMRGPSTARGAHGSRSMLRMQAWMAAAGVLSVAAGTLWDVWFPINKNLWTSSYVLLAAGCAAIGLAGLSWLVDGRPEPWPLWLRVSTWPWFVFGSNAIAAFTFSAVLVKGCLYYTLPDGDDRSPIWEWVYNHCFARTGSNEWTSLAFALAVVAVCFLPNWWLWHKKWFLKV